MKIKNWHKFQHFKNRRPPWIKLYRDLLDDPDWHQLDDRSARILIMLWLLASEDKTQKGRLPKPNKIAFRLRLTEDETNQALSVLSHWIDHDDIKLISGRHQVGSPESEGEGESETERDRESGKYEFESGVIRLNKKNFDDWVRTFPNLNLRASLLSLSPWAEQFGSKWFFPVAAALKNRDAEQALKAKQTGFVRHGPNDPMAGII